MTKKGDTLVEVAFAVGIFSLVAITVVSVISASTSAAQAALETTLTREDIDSQAEALRFIHDSYINGIQSKAEGDNPYEELWNTIGELAYQPNDEIKDYNPESCAAVFNDTGWVENPDPTQSEKQPFIINIRQLDNPKADNIDNIVVRRKSATTDGPFKEAETYPRILYGGMVESCVPGGTEECVKEDLYTQTQGGNNLIYRIEGLYVIAVKGEAVDVNPAGSTSILTPAYYDFYIRSCWMPTNSDRPSTISTLVRLYDPAIITH